MNSRAANNNFQDTMNGRRSSSGSSMSLNPEATEFSCRQPESNRYLVAPSGPSRGGRGKGRGQPGNFPLPHIPPRPGRQGQHQHHQQPPFPKMHDMRPQFPSPPAFGPGQGYQPMFSVLPPPPIPNCMEMPAMPYPPPLPAGFPTQHEGYMGEHQSPGHHGNCFIGGQPDAIRSRDVSISGESHSRSESQSSHGGPIVMTEKMIKEKYSQEFEAARGFEDGRIYCPNLFPEEDE
ncbi:hypothetical protein CIB48_g6999 [Xylaria polymorpha]|nr:hypothetical protein CIB48_g6999 [Xylaria polymorpha]